MIDGLNPGRSTKNLLTHFLLTLQAGSRNHVWRSMGLHLTSQSIHQNSTQLVEGRANYQNDLFRWTNCKNCVLNQYDMSDWTCRSMNESNKWNVMWQGGKMSIWDLPLRATILYEESMITVQCQPVYWRDNSKYAPKILLATLEFCALRIDYTLICIKENSWWCKM